MRERLRAFWTPLRLIEAASVLVVIVITIWELHPGLLVSTTTITGGDTGTHIALPAYLKTQGNLFNLTPWYPGWFAGMPGYTYYFVLTDYLAVIGSYLIGFAVAFKLATVLGSVLMPVGAYLMGRLFGAPRPVPAALALATLPFLFDASYTIDGGNLFSTMAGEYAFSLSLALGLLTIGLFARGVRTGRGYWTAAVALSATLAAHVLPWIFTVGAVGVLVVFELLQRRGIGDPNDKPVFGDYARPFRFAVGAGLLSFGLSAWWLLTFLTTQNLTNSMGYTNDNVSTLHSIFTTLGWYNSTGGAAGDRWVIVLAVVAFVAAFAVRDRLGMILVTLSALSLAAFVVDPQSAIWNERLIPFWFITIHLSAGWLCGYAAYRWVNRPERKRRALLVDVRNERFAYQLDEGAGVFTEPALVSDAAPAMGADLSLAADDSGGDTVEGAEAEGAEGTPEWRAEFEREEHEAHVASRTFRATVAIIVLGLASTLPGLMPPLASAFGLSTSGNQVSSWAQWNYSGYETKPAWPEYRNLVDTMKRVAGHYGCGRAMWEYDSSQNRFGTPMALMLLPYWTNNCVDSMEGLFFESSPTTPYHFLDAAELSLAPSNPQVGLNYGQLDVKFGVQHLQMLGVKYYIAFSTPAIKQANADPALQFVARTKRWPSPGVTWRIYLIKHSPIVQPLHTLPNVVPGMTSRLGWLNANTIWWLNPKLWSTVAASSGPASWPRASSISHMNASTDVPAASVSHVKVGTQSLSFHVSTLGTPILVKISYFPRWNVTGAAGPYRVSPNLMVVVPTSHDVSMVYGTTVMLTLGNIISDVTTLAGLVVLGVVLRRRRIQRK